MKRVIQEKWFGFDSFYFGRFNNFPCRKYLYTYVYMLNNNEWGSEKLEAQTADLLQMKIEKHFKCVLPNGFIKTLCLKKEKHPSLSAATSTIYFEQI